MSLSKYCRVLRTLEATIPLEKLAELSSYQDFRENIEDAFKTLPLL